MPRLPYEDVIPDQPLIPGQVPKAILDSLRAIASVGEDLNKERCGFICCDEGKWFLKEITNSHAFPNNNFKMKFEEQKNFVLSSLEVIAGIWHTHPSGDIQRSHSDKVGFSYSTGWRYFIATTKSVAEYVIDPKNGVVSPDIYV